MSGKVKNTVEIAFGELAETEVQYNRLDGVDAPMRSIPIRDEAGELCGLQIALPMPADISFSRCARNVRAVVTYDMPDKPKPAKYDRLVPAVSGSVCGVCAQPSTRAPGSRCERCGDLTVVRVASELRAAREALRVADAALQAAEAAWLLRDKIPEPVREAAGPLLCEELAQVVAGEIERQGMSQRQAAADMAVSSATLNRWLKGHGEPSGDVVLKALEWLRRTGIRP